MPRPPPVTMATRPFMSASSSVGSAIFTTRPSCGAAPDASDDPPLGGGHVDLDPMGRPRDRAAPALLASASSSRAPRHRDVPRGGHVVLAGPCRDRETLRW